MRITNQPPTGPVWRTYPPQLRNQFRFAFGFKVFGLISVSLFGRAVARLGCGNCRRTGAVTLPPPAEQRDEFALFHCLTPPVLPTEKDSTSVRRETTALRDFNSAYVGSGSKPVKLKASRCFPLFVHERTLAGAVGAAEKCQKLTNIGYSGRSAEIAEGPSLDPTRNTFRRSVSPSIPLSLPSRTALSRATSPAFSTPAGQP